MTQTVPTIVTTESGTQLVTDLNNIVASLLSQHSGTARPSYAVAGTLWRNSSTNVVSLYDGAQDIPLFTLDTTNHLLNPPVGGGTATLSSASTTDLGSVPQAALTISGTTTITSFGTSALVGQIKFLTFSGALTLTHNATSLILPSAANITTAAGDVCIVQCTASGNWRCLAYQRANGQTVGVNGVPNGGTGSPTLTAHGVLIGNGANAVNVTGAGTAGHVLTSNGPSADPTFQAAGGGGAWSVKTSGTFSGASTLDITGLTKTTKVFLIGVTHDTNSTRLYARTSTNGGSSYDVGASDYTFATDDIDSGGVSQANCSGGATFLSLHQAETSTGSTTNSYNTEITIYEPADNTHSQLIRGETVMAESSPACSTHRAAGRRVSATAVNAIRLFPSGGTFSGSYIVMELN